MAETSKSILQVNIDGVTYDLKATKDSDGNKITETYATKSEVVTALEWGEF